MNKDIEDKINLVIANFGTVLEGLLTSKLNADRLRLKEENMRLREEILELKEENLLIRGDRLIMQERLHKFEDPKGMAKKIDEHIAGFTKITDES